MGEGHIDNEPVLQVGIFNSQTNCFDYYTPDEIPHVEELKKRGRETKNIKLTLIFRNDEENKLLLSKLTQQGYKMSDQVTSMDWPDEVKSQNQTLAGGQITLDRVISRGLCKIAFNYLAFSQGSTFVCGSDFHGIRKFIRYDQGSQNEFFFPNQPAILEEDKIFGIKQTHGHLIVLGWNRSTLEARLSLFNMWTFLIKLSTLHGGFWMPINGGHHFDMKSRTVAPLVHINKRFLI